MLFVKWCYYRFSFVLSLAFALAHSLTFSISSWSFLVKPSRKMHCTCVINKCNAIAERKKKNQERSQWILLEIFSMQSDTDMRIFEGFKTNKLDRRNECIKRTVAHCCCFSFFFPFSFSIWCRSEHKNALWIQFNRSPGVSVFARSSMSLGISAKYFLLC